MQMSSKQIFVIVEGNEVDPFFYGEICLSLAKKRPFLYEILAASNLPQAHGSGGKETLLTFFSYLRRRSVLCSTFNGKTTAVVFYADKDIDDILKVCKRSRHLIYTLFYEVENHIFEEGNMTRGVAAAASVDPNLLTGTLTDSHAWCLDASNKWKQWVELCVFARKYKINVECNYRVKSRINITPEGPVDPILHSQHLHKLQIASNLTGAEFKIRFGSVKKCVEHYYSSGRHQHVFKGKWLAFMLSEKVKQLMGSNPYKSSGLKNRLTYTIATTLDFEGGWADHFRKPLDAIVSSL
jgi:hypothetical protein